MYRVKIDENGVHYSRLNGQNVFQHQFLGKEVAEMQNLLKVKGFRVMAKIEQKKMAELIGMPIRTYFDKENTNTFGTEDLKKIKNVLALNGLIVTLDDLA